MRPCQSPALTTICLGWLAAALGCTYGAAQPSPRGETHPGGEPPSSVTAVSPTPAATPAENTRAPGAPERGLPPPQRPLRLATWNLQWLLEADDHGPVARPPAAFARLGKYAQRLDADIVAVQEVESTAALARVFDPERYAFYVTSDPTPQRTGFVYDKRLTTRVHPDYTPLRGANLRSGADLGVEWNGTWIRLLSVHLKSGCYARPLGASEACTKLQAQVPKLEAWLDARAREGTPYAVLGDFNRHLFAASNDPVWRALDDGEPPESDLSAPTRGERSRCWHGLHAEYIDHIVLSRTLTTFLVPGSFAQQLYDAEDAPHRKQLSDHCPISLRLSPEVTPLPNVRQAAETTAPTAPSLPSRPPTLDGATATPPASSTANTQPLPVKGNRSRNGKLYYHSPNCPRYQQVRIDPAKGERLFADEAEALAAGFVRSPDCHRR